MRSFIREKKIFCGDEYREVDIFSYTATQKATARKGSRSKKIKESEPKQKNLNDKNARRYLIQLGNLNFAADENAMHVTSTYNAKHLPESIDEAEREASNYLRRLEYRMKQDGLPPLKYILVTAYSLEKDGETPVRIHHHIIINGGLDRDTVEELWQKRKRKGQKRGDKIGFCNADRLQADENGIAALCAYLAKNPGGKKRWSSSKNLKRPTSRANDGRYTRRQVEKIAKEQMGREFWEQKYPGWTLTDDIYGVTYEHNTVTGWSIYIKLRKKVERGRRNASGVA